MKKPAHPIETYSHNFYAQGAEPSMDNISVERIPAWTPRPAAPQDDIHLIYCRGGGGTLWINGQAQALGAGMMARLFPYHRYSIQPTGRLELWQCRFPLSVLMYTDVKKRFTDSDYSVVETGNPLVALAAGEQPIAESAYTEMGREKTGARPYRFNMVLGNLLRLLALYDRACEDRMEADGPYERTLAWQALQRIHMYFNMENMDAASVAVELGVDARCLGYLLRRLTGQNFTENLHEVRVRNACAMMLFEELSIAFIARYVGYKSTATFYRVFKEAKGVSPDAYRNGVVVDAPRGAHRDTAWKVLVYLLENYADPVTPASVGEVLFIGQDTVEKICRLNFGQSFADLLEQIRLTYACSLLGAVNSPVEDIALAVGYNSPRTFARSFGRHLGTTPSRYRRSIVVSGQRPSSP